MSRKKKLEELRSRVINYMEKKSLSPTDLDKAIGLKRSSMYYFLNGHKGAGSRSARCFEKIETFMNNIDNTYTKMESKKNKKTSFEKFISIFKKKNKNDIIKLHIEADITIEFIEK